MKINNLKISAWSGIVSIILLLIFGITIFFIYPLNKIGLIDIIVFACIVFSAIYLYGFVLIGKAIKNTQFTRMSQLYVLIFVLFLLLIRIGTKYIYDDIGLIIPLALIGLLSFELIRANRLLYLEDVLGKRICKNSLFFVTGIILIFSVILSPIGLILYFIAQSMSVKLFFDIVNGKKDIKIRKEIICKENFRKNLKKASVCSSVNFIASFLLCYVSYAIYYTTGFNTAFTFILGICLFVIGAIISIVFLIRVLKKWNKINK